MRRSTNRLDEGLIFITAILALSILLLLSLRWLQPLSGFGWVTVFAGLVTGVGTLALAAVALWGVREDRKKRREDVGFRKKEREPNCGH